MGLAAKYKKSLDKKWCMRFKTSHPAGDAYDGIVIHIGRKLIALKQEKDFEFDGIQFLPKQILSGYRDDRYERCFNEILRYNGEIKKIDSPRGFNSLETIRQVVEWC